jgi:hypothetical protein
MSIAAWTLSTARNAKWRIAMTTYHFDSNDTHTSRRSKKPHQAGPSLGTCPDSLGLVADSLDDARGTDNHSCTLHTNAPLQAINGRDQYDR